MVLQAQFCQILTYCDNTPKCFFHVIVFICIDFVDLFTDTTQIAIVSFPYKCNAALKNVLWKGQKTVGCLLLCCSLLALASWGSLISSWRLFISLLSGSVHTDFNQNSWFLLEFEAIWALWQTVASSQALWSPTSSALNANHLASCKTREYTASSMCMYILVCPFMYTTFIFLYISKMSIACQIAYCAWLAIVFHVMNSLLVDHACQSSMISWLQVTLECACKLCTISWLQVTLHMHANYDVVAVLAGHLCEFHTKQWEEPCSVPVGCLPMLFCNW
jgi:hypothetical protein